MLAGSLKPEPQTLNLNRYEVESLLGLKLGDVRGARCGKPPTPKQKSTKPSTKHPNPKLSGCVVEFCLLLALETHSHKVQDSEFQEVLVTEELQF